MRYLLFRELHNVSRARNEVQFDWTTSPNLDWMAFIKSEWSTWAQLACIVEKLESARSLTKAIKAQVNCDRRSYHCQLLIRPRRFEQETLPQVSFEHRAGFFAIPYWILQKRSLSSYLALVQPSYTEVPNRSCNSSHLGVDHVRGCGVSFISLLFLSSLLFFIFTNILETCRQLLIATTDLIWPRLRRPIFWSRNETLWWQRQSA